MDAKELSVVEQLREYLLQSDLVSITYSSDIVELDINDIVLGASLSPENKIGIVLSNSTCSLTQFVVQASTLDVERWTASLSTQKNIRIRSHSLSYDNILAFVLLYLRCNGIEDLSPYKKWVLLGEFAKSGIFHRIGAPDQSIYWLVNSLGHGYMNEQNGGVNQRLFSSGFRLVSELLLDAIQSGAEPTDIVATLQNTVALNEALAFYRFSKERYEKIIASGDAVQLLVPVINGHRRMLVDVLLASDKRPLGDIRSFALHDNTHTWRHEGFSIIASFQEIAAGSPYGFTISVLDTRLGISLSQLAIALQKIESSKPHQQTGTSIKCPTWATFYNDTLVRISKDSAPSQLTWRTDILPAIWNEFNPASSLSVLSWQGLAQGVSKSAVGISEITRHEIAGKGFIAGCLYSENDRDDLPSCPTLDRLLVALFSTQSTNGLPALDDLPPISSIKKILIPGGFALIHNLGIIVIDDWTKDEVDFRSYFMEFENVCKRFEEINTFGNRYQMIEFSRTMMGEGSDVNDGKFNRWLEDFARLKLELAQIHADTLSRPTGIFTQTFRQAIETSWGVGEQLHELTQSVDQMQSGIETLFKIRNERAGFKWQRLTKSTSTAFFIAVSLLQVVGIISLTDRRKIEFIIISLAIAAIFGFIVYRKNGSRYRSNNEAK